MSKLIHEIEYTINNEPVYIYIETDDDIGIDAGETHGYITHITTIDTEIGVIPDLIIKRRINE